MRNIMSEKTFSSCFFSNLINSSTNNHFSLSEYFTYEYSSEFDYYYQLPSEICHKSVAVPSSFSYEASNINAICLIHTTKGAGQLFVESTDSHIEKTELTKDSLAIIDCRKYHKLLCNHNIWEYTICFFNTHILDYYINKIYEKGNIIYRLGSNIDAQIYLEQILKNYIDDEIHGILRSKDITKLFSHLCIAATLENNYDCHIPSYLIDLRSKFDNNYYEQYSLDDIAISYRVNKYRLCREFAKYYEHTPIQYLNKVRIDKAKHLLRTTDDKIVEISQTVGIENTNHFIRLFKEKTGTTPLKYRKGSLNF